MDKCILCLDVFAVVWGTMGFTNSLTHAAESLINAFDVNFYTRCLQSFIS